MTKPRRAKAGRSRQPSERVDRPAGTGGFLGQVGLFETANGMPHGPMAILLAIVAAVMVYPIARVVRMLRRR